MWGFWPLGFWSDGVFVIDPADRLPITYSNLSSRNEPAFVRRAKIVSINHVCIALHLPPTHETLVEARNGANHGAIYFIVLRGKGFQIHINAPGF